MFTVGTNSTEYRNQTEADTGYSTPGYSAYQNAGSDSFSADSASTTRTVTNSATIVREITEGTLSAFVGSGTGIIGQFSFKSMLRVDGYFSGRISSAGGTLIVSAGGRVDAKVAVAIAKIHGVVTGDIFAADRIELCRGSRLTGNIQAPTLIVEEGAMLDGSCRMKPEGAASAQKVVSDQETLSVQEAVSVPEAAVDQKAAAKKPPKIKRKENVLGTRTRRARAKTATMKAVDGEPAANAMAG